MPRTRASTRLPLLVACFIACSVILAQASFHLMQIEQVIGGADGDTSAQAIQLRMRNSGQQFVHSARLVAYDSAGANPIVLIDFTSDVAHGNPGDRVLIASPHFADYTAPSLASDFIMANLIPASYLAAGRITYESDTGVVLWSLSFGGSSYTGSTAGAVTNDSDGQFGPSFGGPLPSRRFGALQFQPAASAFSSNNAADYALTSGSATFVNNAGAGFAVVASQPSVNIVAADQSASEPGTNTGKFIISRTGPTNGTLTVDYTLGGTASPGVDYSNLTGSVTIPKGKFFRPIMVKPIDDVLLECPETVVATLTPSSHYDIGSPSNATVTIFDNELPAVSISASDPNASEPGFNGGRFTVTRTGCTNGPLRVLYNVSGTARAGIDYNNLAGAVTIRPGKFLATIGVKPIDDHLVEGSETVVVTISNSSTYLISAPGAATVNILDND